MQAKIVGGLGIRRMQHMNNALVTKSGWSVLVKEDKLWVKLFSSKYLRGRQLWQVPKAKKSVLGFGR